MYTSLTTMSKTMLSHSFEYQLIYWQCCIWFWDSWYYINPIISADVRPDIADMGDIVYIDDRYDIDAKKTMVDAETNTDTNIL